MDGVDFWAGREIERALREFRESDGGAVALEGAVEAVAQAKDLCPCEGCEQLRARVAEMEGTRGTLRGIAKTMVEALRRVVEHDNIQRQSENPSLPEALRDDVDDAIEYGEAEML